MSDHFNEPWRDYPVGLKCYHPFSADCEGRLKCLESRKELVFCSREPFHIRIIRIAENHGHEKRNPLTVQDEQELDECLKKTAASRFRVVSFFQNLSLDPLLCTHDAMMRTLWECGVAPMFLDVILKFGDQEQIFEESSGFRQSFQDMDGSFVLSYQHMYVAPSGRQAPRDPWSYRQTGVYHRFNKDRNSNLFVLLHPKKKAPAQQKLELHASSTDKDRLAEHPMNTHMVLLSTNLNHWQDYIEGLASDFGRLRKYIMVVDSRKSQIEPSKLQELRNIEDKVRCRARASLQSTMKLLKTLESLNGSLKNEEESFTLRSWEVQQQIRALMQRLEGHITAAGLLSQRIEATLGLLSNILDLQNQTASGRTDKHMLKLTRESVDDNATVRVITVCTLIYLPASFIATLLGMNLFEFQSDSGSLKISPFFWIYVAATIPLTALTVGAWYFFKMRHERKRRKQRDEEETQE